MADQKSKANNRWNWEVSGFKPRKSSSNASFSEGGAHRSTSPLLRRNLISTPSLPPKQALASKVNRLKDKVQLAKEDYLELRQEATDLQEYSNAKLDRVTRYLGVLAEKSRKLDQFALETEARISPLINERKRLFNDLLMAKGVSWSGFEGELLLTNQSLTKSLCIQRQSISCLLVTYPGLLLLSH